MFGTEGNALRANRHSNLNLLAGRMKLYLAETECKVPIELPVVDRPICKHGSTACLGEWVDLAFVATSGFEVPFDSESCDPRHSGFAIRQDDETIVLTAVCDSDLIVHLNSPCESELSSPDIR